jgi:hypothetical protein
VETLDNSGLTQLRELCEKNDITRFSAEEIAELLEDGEDPSWIIDQVRSEGPSAAITELEQLLQEMAVPVATAAAEAQSPAELDAEPGAPQAGAPAGGESSMADLTQAMEEMELPPGIDREQFAQLMASPRAALIADFGLFCQEKGVDPEKEHGKDAASDGVLQDLQDEWLETPREGLEGKLPKELLDGGRLFPGGRVATYRREEPKTGRNDPCTCGSGKKFKKCCGKQ